MINEYSNSGSRDPGELEEVGPCLNEHTVLEDYGQRVGSVDSGAEI